MTIPKQIAANKPGKTLLLSGNEAVARGAIEAGITVATSYPGTPSTEILETIATVSKQLGIQAEWSVNEIVATGVASGAAMTGVRSLVSMKHVGVNVASDAIMTLAYTGIVGGMVIVICDDPSMHSSQNEQDTRYFAIHANLPLLDAGNPQEACDMTREAFEISESLQLPVLVRLTTRVAHGKGRVKLGALKQLSRKAIFQKDPARWTMIPAYARIQNKQLHEKTAKASIFAECSQFNRVENNNQKIGIIGSGIGFYHARSILKTRQFSWLKLGFVNPFPNDLVLQFAKKHQKILVVEELRPYLERELRCLDIELLGKKELGLSQLGELNPSLLRKAFAKHGFCISLPQLQFGKLPPRPPALCPGCPHRAFFYALKTLQRQVNCDINRCVGCEICEYICTWEKETVFNPLKSRIRTIRLGLLNNTAIACQLCEDAPCVVACPTDALTQVTETGIIVVNESKCIGCKWCIEACEFGAITLHPDTQRPIICDTCRGTPKCVEWCPEQALEFTTPNQIITGDIGCYTLGALPPINSLDTSLCMGAGISQAIGMKKAGLKEKIFAVIGDSTFFHAGMPGLLNASINQTDVCIAILDNQVTAMTGHQPTPETGKNIVGDDIKAVKISEVVKSLGIDNVSIVDPHDLHETRKTLRELMKFKGPSVVISMRPCTLLEKKGTLRNITSDCISCRECVDVFGCPAISMTSEGALIDETLCNGCGVCESVCPNDAIRRAD